MIQFWDAHTHAAFPAYDADRDEVMRRAKEAGAQMITVGTQVSSSRAAVELAHKYPEDVWATVGFHPAHAVVAGPNVSVGGVWHHDKNEQAKAAPEVFDTAALKALARDPKVVAIGECGLDYFRLATGEMGQATRQKEKQKEVFEAQIKLSFEAKKPLMIHCRSAFPDLIGTLKAYSSQLKAGFPGAIHFFSGTLREAEKLAEMGFGFTFGGVITFSRDYDEVIKFLPMDRILSETDAPYVAPAPYRGKRNEPAYVVETVKKLAELKSISTDEMAAAIRANVRRVFGI